MALPIKNNSNLHERKELLSCSWFRAKPKLQHQLLRSQTRTHTNERQRAHQPSGEHLQKQTLLGMRVVRFSNIDFVSSQPEKSRTRPPHPVTPTTSTQ